MKVRSAGVSPGAVFMLLRETMTPGRAGVKAAMDATGLMVGVEEADGGGVVSEVHTLAGVGAFAPGHGRWPD